VVRTSYVRTIERALIALFSTFLFCITSVHADIAVPANAVVSLNGGNVDLACSDVVVAGTLSLGGGNLANVRNVTILAGGSVDTGAGAITLAGHWNNAGSFNAGTGAVNFVDAPACVPTGTGGAISGNTTFATLSLASALGKRYQFAAGSSQRVMLQLTISGLAGLPIQIESSAAGQSATIALNGQQTMSELAVTDMRSSSVWLAPYLTNRNPAGRVVGWFGEPFAVSVPVLDGQWLWVLAVLLGLMAVLTQRVYNANRRQFNIRND
jgi:hypothetical protein